MDRPMFHFSFPINSLEKARAFYGGILGCPEGRKVEGRVDFNFFGHHLVAHYDPNFEGRDTELAVGTTVKLPVRHFGVIVELQDFEAIVQKLKDGDAHFLVQPQTIAFGEPREQRVTGCSDGCGNALEFKGLPDIAKIFAT